MGESDSLHVSLPLHGVVGICSSSISLVSRSLVAKFSVVLSKCQCDGHLSSDYWVCVLVADLFGITDNASGVSSADVVQVLDLMD